ncbi:MAG TPA: MFS transporter [Acidimicrobiales bacterium]|nr:MFS transporter [Acidimicrobiales bacterium]
MNRATWPTRFGANLGFAALLAVLFLTFLDNTVASAVLTSVQSQLHAGVSELQWVVGSYALAFASLMLLSGSLADSFGRKKVMLIGVGVFCAGSIVAAVAESTTVLIIGRVVMGIGAAASEPGTLSMIRHLFPNPQRRARALGAWAAVSGLALAMGPVLGGVLVGLWSWRAVFWFNLLFGALALVVAAFALPESVNETRRRLDAGGFLVGGLGLATATFATIYGESAGYRSARVVVLYVISALLLILFTFIERRSPEPMLNPRFFRNRAFSGSVFIAFTSYFSIFSIFFFVALYLEVVASVSAYGLAVDFLPLLGGMMAASLFSGRWVGRVGSRTPLTVGCLLAAAGVALTNAAISPAADLTRLGWTMGLAGIGFGIIIVPINATALNSIPASYSGVAASTINTSRELGAVAGVAILGSIVNAQLTVQLTQRLIAIGIPPAYRDQIIAAVTNGAVNSQAKAFSSQSSAAIQAIVNKVVNAAYDAFGHGLDIALTFASLLLVTSAVVAWTTGTREPQFDVLTPHELLSPS